MEQTQVETEIANVSVSGSEITITPKDEHETASIFLAGYNEKCQMVGIYKAEIQNGKYVIQTKENVQDLTWKVFFVGTNTVPKYMAHLLKFES